MGIAKKKRRKIVVNGRDFFWYIAEDDDSFPPTVLNNLHEVNDLHALNVISEDKKFIVRYHLGQENPDTRHLTVIGEEFAGQNYHGSWRRFKCPRWGSRDTVTPKDVRGLIEWCLEENKEIIEVDYRG